MKRRQSDRSVLSTSRDARGAITNLETEGERVKIFSLRKLLTNKRSPTTRDAARLGDVLLPWYEETVAKPAKKLDGIADLWQTHVPPALQQRSRLVGFNRGTLTVALDSAAARAELEMRLREGLLALLQKNSRGALYRVKTCISALPEQSKRG